jgi:hypothetical protein
MNDQSGEGVAVNSEHESATRDHGEREGRPGMPRPEAPESRTRGILREAIHKVMEEIEHHEREAREHLKQAEALRKDLRESVAFLLEQGKVKQMAGAAAALARNTEANAEDQPREAPTSKRRRGRPRRK